MVIRNKNYSDNWFWWGFFFGIIAFIVACTKPQNNSYSETNDNSYAKDTSESNSWECPECGTINSNFVNICNCGCTKNSFWVSASWECPKCRNILPKYVTTCDCGYSKNDNYTSEIEEDKSKTETKYSENTKDNFQEIKKYKDLLDSGIITQEEFNLKKKELLDL